MEKTAEDSHRRLQVDMIKQTFPNLRLDEIGLGTSGSIEVVVGPEGVGAGAGTNVFLFTKEGEVVGLTKQIPDPRMGTKPDFVSFEELKGMDLEPVLESLAGAHFPNEQQGFWWHNVTTKLHGGQDVVLNVFRYNLQSRAEWELLRSTFGRIVNWQAQVK